MRTLDANIYKHIYSNTIIYIDINLLFVNLRFRTLMIIIDTTVFSRTYNKIMWYSYMLFICWRTWCVGILEQIVRNKLSIIIVFSKVTTAQRLLLRSLISVYFKQLLYYNRINLKVDTFKELQWIFYTTLILY